MSQKIVINRCYGGFGLSEKARELLGVSPNYQSAVDRTDPRLVEVVESLGEDSWGDFAELKVVEVPVGVDWTIEEYDGLEWIAEVHRTWS